MSLSESFFMFAFGVIAGACLATYIWLCEIEHVKKSIAQPKQKEDQP